MRDYAERQTVVEYTCTLLQCDLCGRRAEHPELGAFGDGFDNRIGKLSRQWSVGGEGQSYSVDLCYECAEALAKAIANPPPKTALLELIEKGPWQCESTEKNKE